MKQSEVIRAEFLPAIIYGYGWEDDGVWPSHCGVYVDFIPPGYYRCKQCRAEISYTELKLLLAE